MMKCKCNDCGSTWEPTHTLGHLICPECSSFNTESDGVVDLNDFDDEVKGQGWCRQCQADTPRVGYDLRCLFCGGDWS
jgi:Zn finger protein HypA/HybF involved in hydrogenase expression